MKKIKDFFGIDGLLHMMATALIILSVAQLTYWQWGLLAALWIGLGKEVFDHYRGRHAEDHARDLAADGIGIIYAIILCSL